VNVPGRPIDEENSPIERHRERPMASSQVGAPPGRRARRSSILDPAFAGGSSALIQQTEANPQEREVQNARALQVLARIKDKLTGKDFKSSVTNSSLSNAPAVNGGGPRMLMNGNGTTNGSEGGLNGANGAVAVAGEMALQEVGGLGVKEQVEKLIAQATDVENLCQHYIGWCSFW
jgi:serine/threonine-protein kinase mTOR